MKHRPLCMVCLVIFMLLSGVILIGGSFILEELKESPLEKYQSEEDSICVNGTIYDIQMGETYQALYLKDNVISSTKEKHRSYKESRILVYLGKEYIYRKSDSDKRNSEFFSKSQKSWQFRSEIILSKTEYSWDGVGGKRICGFGRNMET